MGDGPFEMLLRVDGGRRSAAPSESPNTVRIVLDTNAVISAFPWNSVPRGLIEAIDEGRAEAYTSRSLPDVVGGDRKAWDSNPRGREPCRFSRPVP